MVAGHCEREGETPRLVGCFSLYPASFLVASAPAELSTQEPSPPVSVLRAALLQPKKLPAMVSHMDCYTGAVLVFLSAWVSKVHWVVLVILTRKMENCQQGTVGFPLLKFSVSGVQGTPPGLVSLIPLIFLIPLVRRWDKSDTLHSLGKLAEILHHLWMSVWCLLLFGRSCLFPFLNRF